MSQRCRCQRCNITIRTIAVTALCSFSLSQRCAHRCPTAVGFLLCSSLHLPCDDGGRQFKSPAYYNKCTGLRLSDLREWIAFNICPNDLLVCVYTPGSTPIYWLYGFVPLERVWFLKPFSLVEGLVIIENWSSIGSPLMGSLTKDWNQEQLSIFRLV